MQIIRDAQDHLKSLGIDQWQDGYPNHERITIDINNKESYKVIDENGVLIATFMFTTRAESTYNAIDGNWITGTEDVYGVIHRIAVAKQAMNRGLGKWIISYCENMLKTKHIKSMRIDTHGDNQGMQKVLLKLDYHYCGIITLASGALRYAYEKVL